MEGISLWSLLIMLICRAEV